MTTPEPQERRLSGERIVALLREVGADLDGQGIRADLFVVGGAAMALAYNTRRLTADVDGVFEPKIKVYEAARRVAARHDDVPEDWLNDGVKGFLPGPDPDATVRFEAPGIRVQVPSAPYLLALKVQAARVDRDADDIQVLARESGARTADEVIAIAQRIIGQDRLAPRAQFMVEQMFPPTASD